MSYDNHPYDDQQLYLSGMYLNGVQSYYSTFSLPNQDVMSMGFVQPIAEAPDAPLEGEVVIERLIVEKEDPLTGFFEGGISGHFKYDEASCYLFDLGYISNYSCNCAVNEMPELETTIQTFGTMKGSITGYGDQPGPEAPNTPELFLVSPGDISVDITNFADGPELNLNTNAVQSFDYSIVIDWEPLYGLGSFRPNGFINKGAAAVEVVMEVELNDSVPPDFTSLVCTPTLKNLVLNVRKCNAACEEGEVIRKFSANCCSLYDYTQISDIDGVLTLELFFRSTATPIGKLGEIVSL
tara:strand:- start:1266 stop:2153 length:888 start_codon:yes stop_codon:yes gene_type:complete